MKTPQWPLSRAPGHWESPLFMTCPRAILRQSLAYGMKSTASPRCRPLFPCAGQVTRADVAASGRAHDVLVFHSLFDGFGLVILEAMAAGFPVIASPRSVGPDIIHDFEDVIVVPAADTAGLRDAIHWMIE